MTPSIYSRAMALLEGKPDPAKPVCAVCNGKGTVMAGRGAGGGLIGFWCGPAPCPSCYWDKILGHLKDTGQWNDEDFDPSKVWCGSE